MRKAQVFYQDKMAGILEETEQGFCFTYDPLYLQDTSSRPISVSLPLQEASYQSADLFPFFDGMIPEGWFLEITSRTLKLDTRDRFGLLLATASHTIGAVSVKEIP